MQRVSMRWLTFPLGIAAINRAACDLKQCEGFVDAAPNFVAMRTNS